MKNYLYMKPSVMAALAVALICSCNPQNDQPQTPESEEVNVEQTQYTNQIDLWPAFDNAANRYGYINRNGEFAIAPQFYGVGSFSCGYAQVMLSSNTYAYIDQTGKIQPSAPFDEAWSFYNGFARIALDGKRGFLNSKMDYAIPPTYSSTTVASVEGLIGVCLLESDLCGYVNTKGEWVIQPMFRDVYAFWGGYADVRDESTNLFGCINTKGEYVFPPIYKTFYALGNNRFFAIDQRDITYIFNEKGEILSQDEYTSFKVPVCVTWNLFAVEKGDKWGYADKDGNEIIPCEYDNAYPFNQGYAIVHKDESDYIIDETGKVKITCNNGEYASKNYVFNGLARTRNDNTIYYKDMNGTIVYSWLVPGATSAPQRPGISEPDWQQTHTRINQDPLDFSL